MLELKDLTKTFDRPVLKKLSFRFPETGVVLLTGASGSGKTTLLRLLCGLEKPDSGEISGLADKKISVAFQEPRLLPFRNLLENILLVRKEKEQNREEALALLERFGLKDAATQKPCTLSGGEKCRAALVRSLYYGGDVFLWDEPTRELDGENRALIQSALSELKEKALVIVSTHDKALYGDLELKL